MEVPWRVQRCRDGCFVVVSFLEGAVCGFSLKNRRQRSVTCMQNIMAYDVLLLYIILQFHIIFYHTISHYTIFIRSYLIVLYSDYCILHYNLLYYFTFHFILIMLHYILSTSLPVKSSILLEMCFKLTWLQVHDSQPFTKSQAFLKTLQGYHFLIGKLYRTTSLDQFQFSN